MICRSCLRRASALRSQPFSQSSRTFSSRSSSLLPELSPRDHPPPAISTGLAQPFSNPLTPSPAIKPKSAKAFVLPESIVPAGVPLKGLNYLKGRDDPVALKEEEYPEWLWKCLEKEEQDDGGDGIGGGDEFSKSKKLRRKAAKRQRKLEARLAAMGNMEALAPKIPITRQTIDLPANEDGSVNGALEAERVREGLRSAMRKERRKGIKEANFLKGM